MFPKLESIFLLIILTQMQYKRVICKMMTGDTLKNLAPNKL